MVCMSEYASKFAYLFTYSLLSVQRYCIALELRERDSLSCTASQDGIAYCDISTSYIVATLFSHQGSEKCNEFR